MLILYFAVLYERLFAIELPRKRSPFTLKRRPLMEGGLHLAKALYILTVLSVYHYSAVTKPPPLLTAIV